MKPWLKKTLFGVFGATLVAACASRGRHGACGGERMVQMRGRLLQRITHKLDLDTAQQQKLATLWDTLQAQRSALRGPGGNPRADMQTLVTGDRFDRTRAQALLDAKLHAAQAGGPEVLSALADFYDGLNPAQQNQVRDFLQRRRGWMWHRS